jgi:hypothetical protein
MFTLRNNNNAVFQLLYNMDCICFLCCTLNISDSVAIIVGWLNISGYPELISDFSLCRGVMFSACMVLVTVFQNTLLCIKNGSLEAVCKN